MAVLGNEVQELLSGIVEGCAVSKDVKKWVKGNIGMRPNK